MQNLWQGVAEEFFVAYAAGISRCIHVDLSLWYQD